jgi:hypothetical protein
MGYGMDGQGLIPGKGKIIPFSSMSRQALGSTQPPIQWVQGALSLGVKRPGHEDDHSPLFSAEVKNGRAIPPLPQYLHGILLNSLSIWILPLPFTPRVNSGNS